LLLGMMSVYLAAGYYFSLRSRNRHHLFLVFIQPFASFCFHVFYGAGTILGLIYLFRKPSPRPVRPGLPVKE
jgi:cytochrome bd-type quinol oxidase subunit 2